ncbi:oligosaccharide flippase family protein [Myroides fluvii]|uniref:oligosaccharide flippase family protein n=1 Tax=Myroides fluvii TaxID=2572594 RepID=UPI00131ECECA|nr:polysaccharide biosynthesis C-terminal domain-containing protein [Myroides fluvii]
MKTRSFIKDFLSIGVSKLLIILCGLISTIVIARYLGPINNGIIATIAVYPSLFMSFGSLGVSQSVTYLLGQEIYSEKKIKEAVIQIWCFTSILSLVICYFLIKEFTSIDSKELWILLGILPIPFTLFNVYNSGIYLGKNRIKEYNRVSWLPSFITLLSNFVLVYFMELGVTGVLISLIIGPLTMSLILIFYNGFLDSFSLRIDKKILSQMLSLGLIYALSLLLINLNYKVDVILLDKLSTQEEIGLYSKGVVIAEYLWQIPMLFSTIVFARSAVAKDGRSFSMKVAMLLRLSFLSIGIFSLVLYFLSNEITSILFGEEFYRSGDVLKSLLPGVLILTVFKVMNMDLAGKGKPWIAIYAMLPALIINVIFNYILIGEYGAKGSAIASTISYSTAGIMFLFFYSKTVKIPIKEIIRPRKQDFMYFKILFEYVKNFKL